MHEEVEKFIVRSMKIDLKLIYEKLNEEQISSHKNELIDAVTEFVRAIINQVESGVVYNSTPMDDSPAEKIIHNYSCDLPDKDAKAVLETLRRAFGSFARGGLRHLFMRQENEAWYPKIVLDEELKPNDIDTLSATVTLYRGTDFAEYNSKKIWSILDYQKECRSQICVYSLSCTALV